jgi:D-cysteine desulfhydrase
MIATPDRVELARTPTPFARLDRTGDKLGVELWIKRDDMTGIELSGNKVRKLEFLFADARAKGADVIITGGGEQSNHCRATALAAARLGLGSVLLLRCLDPDNPPATTGNILLDRLAGARIVWIDHDTWARRAEAFASQADRLRAAGKTPYVIPEGGSSAIGSWGYVACAEELDRDLAALPALPTTIVYACGSGGTGAGLIAGGALLGWADRGIAVAGVNVCDDRDYFARVIGGILADMVGRYDLDSAVASAPIDIVDGYVGAGYAKSRPEELALIAEVARTEAVILDPVYTGKAFYGLVRELERDPQRFGERVVFVHTGGLFGLFPSADKLASILAPSP